MWCIRKHRLHTNQSTRQAERETMNSGYFRSCARRRIISTSSHLEISTRRERLEDLPGDTYLIADRTSFTCKLNTLQSTQGVREKEWKQALDLVPKNN